MPSSGGRCRFFILLLLLPFIRLIIPLIVILRSGKGSFGLETAGNCADVGNRWIVRKMSALTLPRI